MRKSKLREQAKKYSERVIINIGMGIDNDPAINDKYSLQFVQQVSDDFRFILGDRDPTKMTFPEMRELLQPDSLFERFAARKANGIANQKDFLAIKG